MFEILKELGVYGIALAGLLEATILPIPMETISIPIYLSLKESAVYLVIVLIIFSILGSILGYFFWRKIGDPIRNHIFEKDIFIKVKKMYEKNAFLALLSSAITPIPFEGYVIAAGILEIEFRIFLLGTIFSRILRHLPQGLLIYFYGEKILKDLKFYTFITIITILIIILIKYLTFKKKS